MTTQYTILEVSPEFSLIQDEHIQDAAHHLKKLNCGESKVVKVPGLRKWLIAVPKKRADIAAGVLRVFHDLNVSVKN